ncbi:outer membrane protein [Methyloligella solikamskensis]|uniref:Outer membrane protein n=1 Tax=Methyloligella solikamskensis TaxID=1177756 RepID=A0ABW3JBA1_9HYPH
MGWNRAACAAAVFAVFASAAATQANAQVYGDPYGGSMYDSGPSYGGAMFQGWWMGATVGGRSLDTSTTATDDFSGSDFTGGITGGYNIQNGQIVYGAEADLLLGDVSASKSIGGGLYTARSSIGSTGDFKLKAGVTVIPQLLIFGTAGISVADTDVKIKGPVTKSDSGADFGWNIGGGAEVALTQDWSFRFDYQYTDFGSETISYPGGDVKFDNSTNTYRGSISYHF